MYQNLKEEAEEKEEVSDTEIYFPFADEGEEYQPVG